MSVQTEDVEITSTAVEIDTLRVSGRQLTLRTFRQIQEAPVIDSETHEIRGTVWGWVNYFWNGVEGDIHAVWQDENELRRCPLSTITSAKDQVVTESNNPCYPTKTPTDKLESLADAVVEVLNGITDGEHYLHLRYDKEKSDLWESDPFQEFATAVEEYNQRVRDVKNEGQLFIAT